MTDPVTAGSQSRLVRALGPLIATAVVVGTVIGSGIFKKPQGVAENVPYFGFAALAWVLGGILALLGALALAEVAVLYPRAGGNYVFLREGYGRWAGFLYGWVEFWIIRAASLAALATIFSESLHDMLRNPALQQAVHLDLGSQPLGYWEQKGLTVGVISALALVNVRGVRWGGGLQFFITTVKVGSLLAIMALPVVAARLVMPDTPVPHPRPENLEPAWPFEWGQFSLAGFGTAFLGVLWAYHGWMNIAPVAEEVKRPQRNIPLALLGGVGIVMFLYLGANLAYYLIIPREEMAQMKQTAPAAPVTSDTARGPESARDSTVAIGFCRRLLGPIGAAVAAAAVMCSVFGALNGNLLVGPRLLYAMGEDGLAPRALGAVHRRYRTPALAILVMGGWAVSLVLAVAVLTKIEVLPKNKDHFDILTDFAMFGAVIFETMAVLTIFVFRWRLPKAERPYRCPGYPLVPALYVILPIFLLGNMFVRQTLEALTGIGFIAVGAVAYVLLSARNSPVDRSSVRRVRAKDGLP